MDTGTGGGGVAAKQSSEDEDEEYENTKMVDSECTRNIQTTSTNVPINQQQPQTTPLQDPIQQLQQLSSSQIQQQQSSRTVKQYESVPLLDYTTNIMIFIEAILSNNSTDDQCIKSLFDAFYWALSLVDEKNVANGGGKDKLQKGIIEFIESWLVLIQKLITKKIILESKYSMNQPNPNHNPFSLTSSKPQKSLFDPIKFLFKIHKKVINAIKCLWDKNFIRENQLSEIILNILCQILTGIKSQTTTTNASSSNNDLLTATIQSTLLEDIDLLNDDNEQVRRAIAMSLGSDEPPQQHQTMIPKDDKSTTKLTTNTDNDDTQLDKQILDEFSANMLPGLFRILDNVPETVYRVCDLIVVVISLNGDSWRDNCLKYILKEILDLIKIIGDHYVSLEDQPVSSSNNNENFIKCANNDAQKLQSRLLLFSLLFEEIKFFGIKL